MADVHPKEDSELPFVAFDRVSKEQGRGKHLDHVQRYFFNGVLFSVVSSNRITE